jgi:hypothetical protein
MPYGKSTDRRPSDPASTTDDDTRKEAAVLAHVLREHPDRLTLGELERSIAGVPGDFASTDAIERALRNLTRGGLLRLHDDEVTAILAARYFERLRGEW